MKRAPFDLDDVIERLRTAMVARELGTDLEWVGSRTLDDDRFVVIYRHRGRSRDWGILLSLAELSTQYEAPTSGAHVAHLALEEIAEPSRVFTTNAPLAGALVRDPGRVLWRGLDPETPGVLPVRAMPPRSDLDEVGVIYSGSWTRTAGARPTTARTAGSRRWRIAVAWSFALLGAFAVVAIACALAGAALAPSALALGIMLLAFLGFWSRLKAREGEGDLWEVDPTVALASDSSPNDSVADSRRRSNPALALILGGGGAVALGIAVVAALTVTRFGGADPVIRPTVVLLAAGYGAVGGIVSSLATVWLVRGSGLVEGDFARIARLTLFASAIGWGFTYLAFLSRQDVYSPAALIGVPAVVSGLVFAGILKRFVPDEPPRLSARRGVAARGRAIGPAIVVIAALACLAAVAAIVGNIVPNTLVGESLSATFLVLLPQERVSVIVAVAFVLLITAGGCSLGLGVARRSGTGWLGSSHSATRVIAGSLIAVGWPLVHLRWLTAVVSGTLTGVSPRGSLDSLADTLLWATVGGWVALVAGTILVVPDYLSGGELDADADDARDVPPRVRS